MPIRAEFRHLYRREWLTITRPRILARARERCEHCRKPLHAWIFTYTWKTRDPQFSRRFMRSEGKLPRPSCWLRRP